MTKSARSPTDAEAPQGSGNVQAGAVLLLNSGSSSVVLEILDEFRRSGPELAGEAAQTEDEEKRPGQRKQRGKTG